MDKQEIAELKAIVQAALNKVMNAAETTNSGKQKEQLDLCAAGIYRAMGHLEVMQG